MATTNPLELFGGEQSIRDEIGTEDSVNQLTKITDRQDIQIIPLPRITLSRGIATSFILDHPANGVLNTSVLGDFRTTNTVLTTVNEANTFIETFRTDVLKDPSITTATWDSQIDYDILTNTFTSGAGTNILSFTAGQVAQSRSAALKSPDIYSTATMIVTGTTLSNLSLFMSSNGGTTFESVTNSVLHIFSAKTTVGLKWKITASGAATVTKITITYST